MSISICRSGAPHTIAVVVGQGGPTSKKVVPGLTACHRQNRLTRERAHDGSPAQLRSPLWPAACRWRKLESACTDTPLPLGRSTSRMSPTCKTYGPGDERSLITRVWADGDTNVR